jgi:hypothetical protein
MMLFVALLACPRPIPDHLRLDPAAASARPTVAITDLPSALAVVVGRDPLARSPTLPDANQIDEVVGGAPLAAFVRQIRTLEAGDGDIEKSLQALEDEWRGTVAVPLARGYRLRIAENELVNTATDAEQVQQSLLGLLTPLSNGPADPTLPRLPLAWLGEGSPRAYGERWVLESWLAAPEIPVAVLLDPLSAPQYDPLRESALGKLVSARASNASADPAPALADLTRATHLAVVRAAADRDTEQAAWAERKKALETELGDPDPVAKLLERAVDGLTSAAGNPQAAGGALLGLAALRWVGRCEGSGGGGRKGTACAGLDRVETMSAAGRWDPQIASLAAAWQAVAVKEAVDSLEVGRDTVMFPTAMVELADALIGTDAGPLDAAVLRKARPDAAVWLAVTRAVGGDDATDWEGARVALGQHLSRLAARAASGASDAEVRAALETIGKRAVP